MTAAKEVTYVGSTSVFLTDFGTVEATPSRQLVERPLFLLDPDFASLCTLNGRNFLEKDMGKRRRQPADHDHDGMGAQVQAPKATRACG